jgi:purine-nucleoside/S-methyl-5'-thioadenosine phosphorylase / adenosine deaminase
MNSYPMIDATELLPNISIGRWRRERDYLWWEATLEDVTLAFSTRVGGSSTPPYDSLNLGLHVADDPATVIQNRASLWAALASSTAQPILADQVHGTHVETVGREHAGRGWATRVTALPDTDAMVTHDPEVALAILVADCAPVALIAPGRSLGVAHAGWRGLAGGVLEATLREMAAPADAAPHECHAVIGPCIRGCCYEVGEEVWRQFPTTTLAPGDRPDTRRLDLMAAVAHRLQQAGLPADQIHPLGLCTACQPEVFFSHRRTTQAGQTTTGRMALFALNAGDRAAP